MPNSIVAVVDGEFQFDPSVVFDTLRAVWPDTTFTAASGRVATVSAGQIVVNDGEALAEVTASGRGIDIDWRASEFLAEVVSAITSIPGFAAGSTVILADWAWVLPILHEGMSADELLTIRRDGADTQVPSYEP